MGGGDFTLRKKLSYSCKPQSKIQNPTQGMLEKMETYKIA